jgi:histidinol-phosphate aminotransferase
VGDLDICSVVHPRLGKIVIVTGSRSGIGVANLISTAGKGSKLMSHYLSRRELLKRSGIVVGTGVLAPKLLLGSTSPGKSTEPDLPVRLSLNENPYGPSPDVVRAMQLELGRLNRYADETLSRRFAEQVAAYEQISVNQVVLGEILEALGLYLARSAGPGSEFIYSTPGYLALIDAAATAGGIGVPVPLNTQCQNDLPILKSKISARTRAIYLINPHNPTGTTSDDQEFKSFIRESGRQAVVIVDEAYLEYTSDFAKRSAVSLVREGADVVVFRTFDKIHGLAGMPIGYALAPRTLTDELRKQGVGGAEGLGRLNLVGASAALADSAQIESTRKAVAKERELWFSVLGELKLPHTDARANFVFFDAGRPQPILATAMRERGVDIGRPHPPYTNWARITIGLPTENRLAQTALRAALKQS